MVFFRQDLQVEYKINTAIQNPIRDYSSVEKECHNVPHAAGMRPVYHNKVAYLRYAVAHYKPIFYRAIFPNGNGKTLYIIDIQQFMA